MPGIKDVFVLAGLLASAVVVTAAPQKTVDTHYLAVYEEETQNGFTGVPLPYYFGLYYTNLPYGPFDYQSSFCSYVCPQSFPAEVASGPTLGGTPASISTLYKHSNVAHIALRSLYFGCQASVNRTSPDGTFNYTSYEPANCTLTVLGYRAPQGHNLPAAAGVKADVRATFSYRPVLGTNVHTGARSAGMQKAVFSAKEWEGLKVVTFEVHNKVPPYLERALFLMDNLEYVATNRTG